MYKPKFNSVLVEIDETDAKWGSAGEGESISARLGKSYSKGKLVEIGDLMVDDKYDAETLTAAVTLLTEMIGKDIVWNEGHEAGTLFEDGDKLYGFIYWWDIRGVRE